MRKLGWIVLGLLLLSGIAFAQGIQIPRDYAVLSPTVTLSTDQENFTVQFIVRNAGTSASRDTTIRIINMLDNSVMSEDVLTPIANGGSVTVQVPFNTRNFDPGQLPIEIQVGIDDEEPLDSAIGANNVARISVTIPELAPLPQTPGGAPQTTGQGVQLGGTLIPYETIVLAGFAFIAVLIVLWVLSIILRAIFRKPAEFANWQPSYAYAPLTDPNSKEGRRQAWQQHAQNSIILAAPTQNALHCIKVLSATDGEILANWKVTGVRISQYDNYGRVSRSQVIAGGRWLGRLNTLIRRRARMKPERVEKQIKALATQLIQQFRRNINEKSAFLPVALDLRFEGRHGEVRIVFELYQAQAGLWYRLDQWEPAMAVTTPKIQESYTFTIHGKGAGEKLKDYTSRLADDAAWLLNELVRVRTSQVAQPEPQPYNVPDTLTDMKPITI